MKTKIKNVEICLFRVESRIRDVFTYRRSIPDARTNVGERSRGGRTDTVGEGVPGPDYSPVLVLL